PGSSPSGSATKWATTARGRSSGPGGSPSRGRRMIARRSSPRASRRGTASISSASYYSTRTSSSSSTDREPLAGEAAMGPDDRPRIGSTRRDFLRDAAFAVPAIAAVDLLLRGGHLQAAPADGPGRVGPHFEPKARHVIHVFLGGGLSQVDSFDYKPELEKYHGKELPEEFGKADPFFGKLGRLHGAHFAFRKRGQSGLWVSDLFPEIAGGADLPTVIKSMVAETANHIPGTFQANGGFRQMGFPAMGAWLSYGLGSENECLPAFVVLPDARGIPTSAGGAFNWTSGFLPAEHQGVAFNTRGGPPVRDLQPAGGAGPATPRPRRELLKQLDPLHPEERWAQ